MLLCGHLVGHDPDSAFEDAAARDERRGNTAEALREAFDESDLDTSPNGVWKEVFHCENVSQGSRDDEIIGIRFKDQSGEETFFRMTRNTRMKTAIKAYAKRKGVQPSVLRCMLASESFDPNETPITLEMEDGEQIDVVIEQSGC